MERLELTYNTSDNIKRGGIAVKNRIKPLCLLGWVIGVRVTDLPLFMARTGLTAPTPKVASGKLSAFPCIVSNELENIFIICISAPGRRARLEAHTITRITKLFHHKRLIESLTNS